jgi:hypothetical protein
MHAYARVQRTYTDNRHFSREEDAMYLPLAHVTREELLAHMEFPVAKLFEQVQPREIDRTGAETISCKLFQKKAPTS